jgi:hypothetical protein
VVLVVSALLVWSAPLRAQEDVTFQVNMKIKMLEGTFQPGSGDIVRVAGSFNDWGNSTDTLTDLDGDSVYAGTLHLDTVAIQYKFLKTLRGGLDWESVPNRNYTVTSGGPQTIPAVYFDDDSVYTPPVPANVTFQVNMKVKILEQSFQPGAGDIVRVAGSFNNWGSSTDTLTDLDNDSVYSKTISLLENQAIQYKYLKTPRGGLDWENIANREYTVPVGGGPIPAVYFDNDSVTNTPITANILFQVDMNPYLQIGFFRPDLGDSVEVRGAFNAWGGTKMDENVFTPGIYELVVPYSGTAFDDLQFKYFLDADSANALTRWPTFSGTIRDGICYEHPSERGDGNRIFNVGTGGDIIVPSYYFSSINPGGIIPAGDTVTVTLAVNMNPAKSYTIPFDPLADTLRLVWTDASYTWTYWQERIQGSFPLTLSPSAVDGDSIYYFTFDIVGPAPYNLQYRYRYIQGGGSTVDQGGGLGAQNPNNSRYIQPTSPNVFPRNYNAPVDTWKHDTPLYAETPPLNIVTGVEEGTGTGRPVSYNLSQNYPNPFNPATRISFALPQKEHVVLKVYNLLGQEVATVVNAEKTAGNYTVEFNADKLGTGIYFYRINAGSFTQVKKMVIVK